MVKSIHEIANELNIEFSDLIKSKGVLSISIKNKFKEIGAKYKTEISFFLKDEVFQEENLLFLEYRSAYINYSSAGDYENAAKAKEKALSIYLYANENSKDTFFKVTGDNEISYPTYFDENEPINDWLNDILSINMKYSRLTFHDLARLGKKKLAKQPPLTVEEMRAQVLWLKNRSSAENKKKRGSE
ncbi:MAG: hypothetical protein POELPBGB_03627 [Bacteroidia bacterium]|nr:hypothetical protein [Bacteroidia bacterium]